VPVWTPYLRGERVPYNDTSLRSSLQGLDITHDADDLERAAYESSGFVIRHMLDLGQIKASRIVASGGGTRVTAWMQAMADAAGLPVDVVAVPEGAALGAAYLARLAAGLEESLDGARRWARVGYRVEPDAAWQEAAAKRYARFRALGPTH
jgi:xylulokinase